SVLPTLRLWIATLKSLRARFRARLEPITAMPVTPMSATSAGDGENRAMGVSPVVEWRSGGNARSGTPAGASYRDIAAHSRDESRSGEEVTVCCHRSPVAGHRPTNLTLMAAGLRRSLAG